MHNHVQVSANCNYTRKPYEKIQSSVHFPFLGYHHQRGGRYSSKLLKIVTVPPTFFFYRLDLGNSKIDMASTSLFFIITGRFGHLQFVSLNFLLLWCAVFYNSSIIFKGVRENKIYMTKSNLSDCLRTA